MEELNILYSKLHSDLEVLSKICSFRETDTIDDIQELLDASEILNVSPNVTSELLKNIRWNNVSADVENIISSVKTHYVIEKRYGEFYNFKIFNEDIEGIYQRNKLVEKSYFKLLRPSYWKDNNHKYYINKLLCQHYENSSFLF